MSSETPPTFNSNEFWKEQEYESSARLHLQHWICQFQLGYTLHPKIDIKDKTSLKIADIAAGNGAWILETASTLPDTTTFLGLDITASSFPAQAWLPSNISFKVWDAYSALSDEYSSAFDIVHLRALYSTVHDNKVSPLLANALAMLKPGGYLQWDESDASTLACYSPNPDEVKMDATQKLINLQNFSARTFTKMSPDWLHALPATLADRSCEVVAHEEYEPEPRLARAWTDNMLLVWRGMVALLPEQEMPLPPGMGLPETLGKVSFVELFREAVEETRQGVRLGMKYHVFVARKAGEGV